MSLRSGKRWRTRICSSKCSSSRLLDMVVSVHESSPVWPTPLSARYSCLKVGAPPRHPRPPLREMAVGLCRRVVVIPSRRHPGCRGCPRRRRVPARRGGRQPVRGSTHSRAGSQGCLAAPEPPVKAQAATGCLRQTLTGGLRHHFGRACRREGMTTQNLICGLCPYLTGCLRATDSGSHDSRRAQH
jgi:hypothetical protein